MRESFNVTCGSIREISMGQAHDDHKRERETSRGRERENLDLDLDLEGRLSDLSWGREREVQKVEHINSVKCSSSSTDR